MNEQEFVGGSQATWRRLGSAVEHASHHGVASLGAHDLKRMHEDYRTSASDLAYAQTHFPGSAATAHLNSLVARAHAELYGAPPRRMAALWRFLSAGYPRLVRTHWRPVLASSALLVLATIVGFSTSYANPQVARMMLPAQMRDYVPEAGRAEAELVGLEQAPAMSSAITVNNVRVSFMAFAGGMTFGVLTIYALVMNGAMLGVLAGVSQQSGTGLEFWTLIVPHGALELPAIALAGASGLLLARALVFPGDLPRRTALRLVTDDALKLVMGAVPLLVIAGLIEAFITPQAFATELKLAIGVAAAVGLAAYIVLPGRRTDREPAAGDAVGAGEATHVRVHSL